MRDRQSRREFMGMTAVGLAGAMTPSWLGGSRGFSMARWLEPAEADLIVVNAKVYTMDATTPRAEAFAMKGGRFVAVGRTADIRGLAGKRTQTFDAKQMTIVPGFTDYAQPRGRHDAALRGARRQSVRGGVRHDREHHRQAQGESAADAAGHVGGGVLPRRHEAQGQAAAQPARPRSGVDGASGRRAASRRPHVVLQQQGVRARGHHEATRRIPRAARSIATKPAT